MTGGPAFWFFMQNYSGAPWDYKNTRGHQYDDAGNFNYGVTGTAVGIPGSILLGGADAFKDLMNAIRNKPIHGNEPEKNAMIQRGIDYVKAGCLKGFTLRF